LARLHVAPRPAIRAERITKTFAVGGLLTHARQHVEALAGADLTVAAGSIHGIIGPNGSGKSTLLRILATLVLPDGGTATVAGHDVVTEAPAVRRSIGFSTGEERAAYWRLSARQNLQFAAALHDIPDEAAAIDASLVAARLDHAADRPVSGFSQGMARRLGLARALLHRPPVLFLDEPARSLDPVARDELHTMLLGLRDVGHTTVVLTTHDMTEAVAICDTVSVLRGGRVVDVLAPSDEAVLDEALRRPLDDSLESAS
jgi:ABC-2 type transport system ATP-binding protein